MAEERAAAATDGACAGRGAAESSEGGGTTSASYAIYSGRDRVGDIDSVHRVDGSGRRLEIDTRTSIEIDAFFWSYSLAAVESICILDGRLEYYSGKLDENGEKSSVRASRTDDGSLAMSGSGPSEEDTFEEVFEGESYTMPSRTVIGSVAAGRTPSLTAEVIDLDDLEVKEMTYRYGGTAEVNIGTSSYETHVVEFEASDKRGTQWLVPEHGGFLTVLERGEDEDGDYSVELQELRRANTQSRH